MLEAELREILSLETTTALSCFEGFLPKGVERAFRDMGGVESSVQICRFGYTLVREKIQSGDIYRRGA